MYLSEHAVNEVGNDTKKIELIKYLGNIFGIRIDHFWQKICLMAMKLKISKTIPDNEKDRDILITILIL